MNRSDERPTMERMNTKRKRVSIEAKLRAGNKVRKGGERRGSPKRVRGSLVEAVREVIREVVATLLPVILLILVLINTGLLQLMNGLEFFTELPEPDRLEIPDGQRTPNTEESSESGRHGTRAEEGRIIMAETRYLAVMPVPGTPGAPFFEGANVTEFLERYGDQCEDAALKDSDKVKRLPRYCSLSIGQYIKTLPEWIGRNWEELSAVMEEEYKDQDTFQQMNSRSFLEALKAKPRTTEDDVRQFIRQYTAVSAALVKKGQLEGYTRGVWFLNGLPADVRGKVIRKNKVNIDSPATIDFEKLAKTATEIYTSNKTVREFSDSRAKQEGLSELVDSLGHAPAVPKSENRLVPPIVAPRGVSVETVDELTEAFNALALAARATLGAGPGASRAPFNPPGGGNQPGAYPSGPSGRIDLSAPPGTNYPGWHPSNPPVGVGAATAFSDRPTGCFYCMEAGHFRRDCPDFLIDAERGLVHESAGRVYYGKAGQGGQAVWMRRGMPQRDTVRRDWKVGSPAASSQGTSGVPTEVLQRPPQNVGTVGVKSAGVIDWEGSDVEEEYVSISGARTDQRNGKDDEKWANPRKVLKGRIAKEKNLAAPKVPRLGQWKPADRVVEVSSEGETAEGAIVEEMEIDEEQTEKLKKVGPRVARKVEKYVDLLKKGADPMGLLDKVLDNELKGITGREVLACSDILQKLLFKNMASVKRSWSIRDQTPPPEVIEVNSIDVREIERMFVVRSPRVMVRIGSLSIKALIDCGAEANLMTVELAARAGLPIRPNPKLGMVGHLGERERFGGLCEEVPVSVGSVTVSSNFFTLQKAENELVLGQPFIVASLLSFSYSDGGQNATIVNDERTKQVTIRVANLSDLRTEADIFPENE